MTTGGQRPPVLTAYCTNPFLAMPLSPASAHRPWMKATDKSFANRCLPLLIANQSGWFLLSSHTLRIIWTGGRSPSSLHLEYLSGEPPFPAVSHFGYGILTWTVPYLFRTPPGYNLQVRGPANSPKDGVYPLEGIVEADWSDATFTMNWKVTRRQRPITFNAGEPIAQLVPQRRGELEAFQAEIQSIQGTPEIERAFQEWTNSRSVFNAELIQPDSQAHQQGWQRHYFQGRSVAGPPAREHQTRLLLHPFIDRR